MQTTYGLNFMMQAVYNQKLIRLKKLVTVELDNNLLRGTWNAPAGGTMSEGAWTPCHVGGGGGI